jgi:hypothetical protein
VQIRKPWVVDKEAWRWAVEIDQMDGQQFVRVIDDGKVSIRAFRHLPDAERFAESERQRMKLPRIVYRHP